MNKNVLVYRIDRNDTIVSKAEPALAAGLAFRCAVCMYGRRDYCVRSLFESEKIAGPNREVRRWLEAQQYGAGTAALTGRGLSSV